MRRSLLCLLLVASGLAIARPADAITFRRVISAPVTVGLGETKTASVHCPRKTRVVSGGASWSTLEQGVQLRVTEPFDDTDRKRIPDDGWIVTGYNGTINSRTLQAHAICVKQTRKKKVQLLYRTSTVDVPSAATPTSLNVGCSNRAKDLAVGGGAALNGVGWLRGSIPFLDLAEADSEPEDGWRGVANNVSGSTIQMRVTTICERKLNYRYQFQGVAFGATGDVDFTPACDPGEVVVGGGGEIAEFTTLPMYLQTTFPVGNAWRVDARNDTVTGADFVVYAICRMG